ncbi:MAG: hypothetical protein WCV62_06755 [Candidatus Peribacteraceae bacterium]|jgi:hypothetical protein
MANKNASAPRRIYTRNGLAMVLFEGLMFGIDADSETKIDLERQVTCEPAGETSVKITQRVKGRKPVSEVWEAVTLDVKKRVA